MAVNSCMIYESQLKWCLECFDWRRWKLLVLWPCRCMAPKCGSVVQWSAGQPPVGCVSVYAWSSCGGEEAIPHWYAVCIYSRQTTSWPEHCPGVGARRVTLPPRYPVSTTLMTSSSPLSTTKTTTTYWSRNSPSQSVRSALVHFRKSCVFECFAIWIRFGIDFLCWPWCAGSGV